MKRSLVDEDLETIPRHLHDGKWMKLLGQQEPQRQRRQVVLEDTFLRERRVETPSAPTGFPLQPLHLKRQDGEEALPSAEEYAIYLLHHDAALSGTPPGM